MPKLTARRIGFLFVPLGIWLVPVSLVGASTMRKCQNSTPIFRY
jgi:hypothetical protein